MLAWELGQHIVGFTKKKESRSFLNDMPLIIPVPIGTMGYHSQSQPAAETQGANTQADFDDVMSKLAGNWWVDDLLVSPEWAARSPSRPPLSPIPPGDRYMIDELRALARQPWEERPWPDPPT